MLNSAFFSSSLYLNFSFKYEENPIFQEYIKSRLSEKKDKIRVPQLATILIKPVQRIFKYPLFLTRLSEVSIWKFIQIGNFSKLKLDIRIIR